MDVAERQNTWMAVVNTALRVELDRSSGISPSLGVAMGVTDPRLFQAAPALTSYIHQASDVLLTDEQLIDLLGVLKGRAPRDGEQIADYSLPDVGTGVDTAALPARVPRTVDTADHGREDVAIADRYQGDATPRSRTVNVGVATKRARGATTGIGR